MTIPDYDICDCGICGIHSKCRGEPQAQLFEFLNKIPEGWRFHTCDWSIENKCFIRLVRTEKDRKKWHKLSEEQKEIIDLYILGIGQNFDQAVHNAIGKCLPIEEDYQI